MIALETLKNKLQATLESINTNLGYNFNFNIMTDTGKYKEPDRFENTVIEYTNGVLTVVNSEVSELTDGILYATQTCNLLIEIDLPNHLEDREYNGLVIMGSERKKKEMRKILETLTQKQTYEDVTDQDGTTYLVTTVYSIASSGQRAQIAKEGDSFTFSVFIYYAFVENGVNSRNVLFTVDGVPFPYQAVTLNRAKTYDSNVYANTDSGSIKNMPIQSNWSAVFEIPALVGEIYSKCIAELTANDSLETVHTLNYTLNGQSYTQLVTIGEITLNAQGNQNVTLKVPFYEAVTNYLQVAFPKGYCVYMTNSIDRYTPINFNFGEDKGGSIIAYDDITLNLINTRTVGKGLNLSENVALNYIAVTSSELVNNNNDFILIKKIV